MRFVTSDCHFRHKNITKYTDRGKLTSPEEHDNWLTDLWNNQVADKDEIIVLGDFCFAKGYETLKDIVTRLKGKKQFILGNHDSESNFARLHRDGLIEWYGHYKEIKIGEQKVVLFHFPILAWHRQHYGSWHLCGHLHGSLLPENNRGKMLDVGLDNAYNLYGEHKFFTEQMLSDYMQTKEIYIADGHTNRSGE